MCRQRCKYISQFYYGGQLPIFPHSSLFTAGNNDDGQLARDTSDFLLVKQQARSLGSNTASSRGLNIGAANFGIVVRPSNTATSSLGYYHTLIIDNTGSVFASGNNIYGQLGCGDNDDRNPAVPVDTSGAMNGAIITKVSAGLYHSMALSSDGQVFAWGRGDLGQLGQQVNNDDSNIPLLVSFFTGMFITDISAGGFHSMALDSNGTVYNWGSNDKSQLGNNSTANSWTPIPVSITNGLLSAFRGPSDPLPITQVVAGCKHSVALDAVTGTAIFWGDNQFNQSGIPISDSPPPTVTEPIKVENTGSGGTLLKKMFGGSGANHTFGIDYTDILYAFGHNHKNQCGIVNSGFFTTINPIAPVTTTNYVGQTPIDAGAGVVSSIMITSTNVYTTGDNQDGQRGTGMTGDHSDIFALANMSDFPPGSTFTQVSAGGGLVSTEDVPLRSHSAVVVKFKNTSVLAA